MNNNIKEYTTPRGKKRYKFSIYVGKDETTGRSIQVRKGSFKSYEDALQSYQEIQKKIRNGEYTSLNSRRYKFSKFYYDVWLSIYKKTVKETTWVNVSKYFENHILKDIGNVYLDKLTPLKCQNVVNKWFTQCGYATFDALFVYTTKFLDYAVRIDVLERNPMRKVYKPKKKVVKKQFDDFYTKAELLEYLNKCKKDKPLKVYTMFQLLAYTGLRVGEALALKWSDIDLNNGTLDVNKTVSTGEKNRLVINTPKTSNSYRTIELAPQTVKTLKEWRFQQRRDLFKLGLNPLSKEQLVFNNKNNSYLRANVVNYWNVTLCKKENLRHIKLHGFRHTHASLLFKAGASMEDVKARLGHGSIKTTMDIYTHVSESDKKETANIFGEFMQM